MNHPSQNPPPPFDQYADNYDAALNQGLKLSGQSKSFFIHARIHFLKKQLARYPLPPAPHRILDFGCGTGDSFPSLASLLPSPQIIGIDTSQSQLDIAQKNHPASQTYTPTSAPPNLAATLAYSNGTFHHIPPPDRPNALRFLHQNLQPNALFALWENNPLNPGTRLIMSRIPFDKDAITLRASHARRLLRAAGFQILRTDFLFLFPRPLSLLRPLELLLTKFPLAAQYQILARRP